MFFILFLIVLGMAAGWAANLILGGGRRPRDWGELIVAGLVGSFVGGLLANLLAGNGFKFKPTGLIGSIVGAVVVLALWRGIKAATSTGAKSGSGASRTNARSKKKRK